MVQKCVTMWSAFKKRLKLLPSLLALLGCLLAASQMHVHEAGFYAADHTCISCDLEDIVAHGVAPSNAFMLLQPMADTEVVSSRHFLLTSHRTLTSIRAPPAYA